MIGRKIAVKDKNETSRSRAATGVSETRKKYILRLVFRSIVFAACLCAVFFFPDEFDVLQGWNFFHRFSPLHILWIVWIFDMLWQLIPVKNKLPLGSQKHFLMRFKPIKDAINYKALRKYIIDTTKSAYKVMIIWIALTLTLAVLRLSDVLNDTHLFMISCAFYVCDLICVLVWCPFRLIMRNRCCTTCRIFNWDHLMMFTPMIAVKGFYSASLILMAFAAWLIWELCVMMFPERFWEHSNAALRCSDCTDKLCTQYCKKLRKEKSTALNTGKSKGDDVYEKQ